MAVVINGEEVAIGADLNSGSSASTKRNYTDLLVDPITTTRRDPPDNTTQKLTVTIAAPTAGKRIEVQIFSGAIVDASATSLEDRWERVQTVGEFGIDDFLSGDTDTSAVAVQTIREW